MKSLFEIERRFNFKISYNRLINLADEKIFFDNENHRFPVDLWEIINRQIRNWKYRGNANNYQQFFQDIGIDVLRGDVSDNTKVYVMEFLINIIAFIVKDVLGEYSPLKEPYLNVLENIDYMLEKLNFEAYEVDDRIQFAKRDADVDSVLPIISNNEELRVALLEYNDFRLENNIEEKGLLLFKIGKWMEPKRSIYKGLNSDLTDVVFRLLNKIEIRHNNKEQLNIPREELIVLYDKLFKMMLHLIRIEEINKYKKELKAVANH